MNQRNGLDEKTIKGLSKVEERDQEKIDFDHLCQFFLKNRTGVENDLTLSYQKNTIQIDKLLMTEKIVYLIDVKYYRGHYVFENNEWRVGNSILSNNIYEQLRRAVRIVKNILREAELDVKVQGVLVFTNPESTEDELEANNPPPKYKKYEMGSRFELHIVSNKKEPNNIGSFLI